MRIRDLCLGAMALAAVALAGCNDRHAAVAAAPEAPASTAPASDAVPPPPQPREVTAADGRLCGGVAGVQCPAGQFCDIPPVTHPDAQGVCRPKGRTAKPRPRA